MRLPQRAKDYYDTMPSGEHRPGDIWSGLPTFGVLPFSHVSGLVVTPSCDLVNRKVEALTFLPIVSVRAYLASVSILPELKRRLEGQLKAAGVNDFPSLVQGYACPGVAELSTLQGKVESRSLEKRLNDKERAAIKCAEAGIQLLLSISNGRLDIKEDHERARTILGAQHGEIVRDIIKNSYRTDIHFLPHDEQQLDWSGVREHSVAMFRYPLSIPIELLDMANELGEATWLEAKGRVESVYPCSAALIGRPLKLLRLTPIYLSDLLTRFTTLFSRLGSPDFTENTVSAYLTEIGEYK